MYTSEMRRAVHSLAHYSPKNFYLDIVDEDHFITVVAPEKVFMALRDVESKRRAVDYMIRIKKALEDNGAIVLLVREGGKDERK